ncbi:MAG TPA: hypothetical protein VK489_00340, partial [Ferruginibacter sp.]|nr:hypothetical protein [Ferruginibacter sp.]
LNGDPMGYFQGAVSKNYTSLTGVATTLDDLVYIGPTLPLFTASLGNTVQWKRFSVTIRVSGKFGYYFLRQSVDYGTLFKGGAGHADYALRWQQTGDEKFTSVPSMTFPAVTRRDNFYRYADVLASRADHIRLQYITITYEIKKPSLQFYINLNNAGLLWKANSFGIDPEYNNTLTPSKNVVLGLKAEF